MNDKDLLGIELKKIMDEDTKNMNLSTEYIEDLIGRRNITWIDKLKAFLNKEIEIPLAPAIVALALSLIISIVPRGAFKIGNTTVINLSYSQILVREKEVSQNEAKD